MIVEIPLTQGKVAIIDDEDYPMVSAHKWHTKKSHNTFYAQTEVHNSATKCGTTSLLLHRFIMNAPENMQVDHINRNGLDNRKTNMRIVTQQENMLNLGPRKTNKAGLKYRGVFFIKGREGRKCWSVTIQFKNKRHFFGTYADQHEAAMVYNREATKFFGEYACLNTIRPLEYDTAVGLVGSLCS